MTKEPHKAFIKKLEEKYGNWEKKTSKFGVTSYGQITRELCVSKSHFSMLIWGGGTEGMYIRSNRNIDRLIKYEQQKKELEKIKKEPLSINIKIVVILLSIAVCIGYLIHTMFAKSKAATIAEAQALTSNHPLSKYFDGNYKTNYVSPYLKETEVQEYCPASAYEGIWELESEYIIPLPNKKPGLYYVAKSADIRIKCNKSLQKYKKGKSLFGFEHMHNELWIDTKRTPISPKYFNQELKSFTEDFYNLDLNNNPNFIKVADVYSCFFDQFTIGKEKIIRKGEPCGRYATNVNTEIVDQFEIDIKYILENVIGSMSQTTCSPAINVYCNPNTLQENVSTISYNCLFKIKTENLGMGGGYPYQKKYRLVKQNYSDNLLCRCDD